MKIRVEFAKEAREWISMVRKEWNPVAVFTLVDVMGIKLGMMPLF